MKNLFLFTLIFLTFTLKSQTSSLCLCKSLIKYEDSVKRSYKKMESIVKDAKSKNNSLKKPFDFIQTTNIKNPAKISDIVDSLDLKYQQIIKNKVSDSIFGFYKIEDSLRKDSFNHQYYGIPEHLILKTGKINGRMGILYSVNSAFKTKYYLSISEDEGKTWKNYFTGLYKDNHYVFKSNSKFPLWKDENKIQIESNIVRMVDSLEFPGGGPNYETIKSDILVTIHLKEILKDSDKDGWNDLDEKMNYFTNPFLKDTDGDGVSDSEDLNPKYSTVENDFSKIFEAIIYGNFTLLESLNPREDSFEINLQTFKEDMQKQRGIIDAEYLKIENNFLSRFQTKVIITDDENLRRINTFGERIIFLTSTEYEEYQKINPFNRYCQSYSKIFKCDTLEDTYVLKYDGISYGNTYLIKKTQNGYVITILENWMS